MKIFATCVAFDTFGSTICFQTLSAQATPLTRHRRNIKMINARRRWGSLLETVEERPLERIHTVFNQRPMEARGPIRLTGGTGRPSTKKSPVLYCLDLEPVWHVAPLVPKLSKHEIEEMNKVADYSFAPHVQCSLSVPHGLINKQYAAVSHEHAVSMCAFFSRGQISTAVTFCFGNDFCSLFKNVFLKLM